jgi:DNA-binding CsgD family transcriptional regulator
MIYNSSSKQSTGKSNNSVLKLVSATCYNEKGRIIDLNIMNQTSFEIPYKYRNLVFNYAIPGNLPESYSINYKLDNDQWIDNGIAKSVTFNYLPLGKHELKARAVDESHNMLSEISYNVKILPPWYLKSYALLVYLFIATGIAYFIYVFNRLRLKKQKLAYLKKIKSDNTRQIIRMKNQHLHNEIQTKSVQLVNYTVLLRTKNEVLIRIKEILDKSMQFRSNGDKYTSQIYNIIAQNLSDKNHWKTFSSHFDEAHSNFLKKLKKEHEILTPPDLQLCAFLKMNLSSKEIASLLNISLRSVEVKRYRLRKKLDLGHDANLVEYIMST